MGEMMKRAVSNDYAGYRFITTVIAASFCNNGQVAVILPRALIPSNSTQSDFALRHEASSGSCAFG